MSGSCYNCGGHCEYPEAPPPTESGPDRCKIIKPISRTSQSSTPKAEFGFMASEYENTCVDIRWEASSRSRPGISFLDLPAELRNKIYQDICGDLKREGLRWEETRPGVGLDDSEEWPAEILDMRRLRPEVFSDCAIMRACRQTHAEFAECLYSIPLQVFFRKTCLHILPFSPLYIPLVRSVLAIYDGADVNWTAIWPSALQIANALAMTFPNLDTQRVGWWGHMEVNGEEWTDLMQCDWDEGVRGAMKYLKIAKQLMDPPLNIPHNMELVELFELSEMWEDRCYLAQIPIEVRSLASPLGDAVQKMRAIQREKYRKNQKIIVW